MKKTITVICLAALFSCSHKNKVVAIEKLPTHQSIYTVETDSVPYTFIDDNNAYKIGSEIK
jgi:hypothetical protein